MRDLGALFSSGGARGILPLLNNPEALGKRVMRVVVKPFMDAHTYDQKRIEQCCTELLDENGEAISFCEYNTFHRWRRSPEILEPLPLLRHANCAAQESNSETQYSH